MIKVAIALAAAATSFVLGAPALASQYGGPAAILTPQPAEQEASAWQIKGDRTIRPTRVSDDGLRTYLEWRPEQSLPAVFAIGATGAEEVVDGYMRGTVFVIDRVHERLVFRIDGDKAIATRKGSAR